MLATVSIRQNFIKLDWIDFYGIYENHDDASLFNDVLGNLSYPTLVCHNSLACITPGPDAFHYLFSANSILGSIVTCG